MQLPLSEHINQVICRYQFCQINFLLLQSHDSLLDHILDAPGDELPADEHILLRISFNELLKCILIWLFNENIASSVRVCLIQLADADLT
jgi:hypothetical protein